MYKAKLNFFYDNVSLDKNTLVTTHSHNCFEIVYFSKANGTLTINDSNMHIDSGTIYLIYPGTNHSEIHYIDGKVSFIGFECSDFPKSILHEGIYEISNHKKIYNLIQLIIEEGTSQKKNYSEIISCLLDEILFNLDRYASEGFHSVKSFDFVYNYIIEYYNQNIDLEQLAKLSGYSADRFRHIFVHKIGCSPKQFQINMRLEKSVDMLKNSNMNCSSIAEACGFSTNAQFSKMFRDRFGVSPSEFRSQSR